MIRHCYLVNCYLGQGLKKVEWGNRLMGEWGNRLRRVEKLKGLKVENFKRGDR